MPVSRKEAPQDSLDVSVIVPAYKADATLGPCVNALLAQRFRGSYEVIVCTSADTRAQLTRLPDNPRLHVLTAVPRLAAAPARNRAVRTARGRLLAFTDADGLAKPDWLKHLVDSSRGKLCVAGAMENGTPDSRVGTAEYLVRLFEFHPSRPASTAFHGATGNLLIPRALWDKFGPFPEDMGGSEDTWLTMQTAEAGLFVFSPEARVSILNRTRLRDLLSVQFRKGIHQARLAHRLPIASRPWLRQPVLAPMAAAGQLVRLYARVFRRTPSEVGTSLLSLPIVVTALASWSLGVIAYGIVRIRRQLVTWATPYADGLYGQFVSVSNRRQKGGGPTVDDQPRMADTLAGFLPAVLRNREFQCDGILFGTEPGGRIGLHWVVIDPRRHVMHVWRKKTSWFTEAAEDLGASVFTNGPFCNYRHGTWTRSTLHALWEFVSTGMQRPRLTEWRHIKIRNFGAVAPLGYVVGSSERINETRVSRPYLHYFGRRNGHAFDDYEIAKGDPDEMSEAVGGLFRAITDYTPYSIRRHIGIGLWGLAPLHGDPLLESAGVDAALESYGAGALTSASSKPCKGLIVAAVYWGSTQTIAHLLAAVRVKDAVQIDGNDSLLMGHGSSIHVGSNMPKRKQFLQAWGYQFRPLQPLSEEPSTALDTT